jgi:hypothetical protein
MNSINYERIDDEFNMVRNVYSRQLVCKELTNINRLLVVPERENLKEVLSKFNHIQHLFIVMEHLYPTAKLKNIEIDGASLKFNYEGKTAAFRSGNTFNFDYLPNCKYLLSINNYNLPIDHYLPNIHSKIIDMTNNPSFDFFPVNYSSETDFLFFDSVYLDQALPYLIQYLHPKMKILVMNNNRISTGLNPFGEFIYEDYKYCKSILQIDLEKIIAMRFSPLEEPKYLDSCLRRAMQIERSNEISRRANDSILAINYRLLFEIIEAMNPVTTPKFESFFLDTLKENKGRTTILIKNKNDGKVRLKCQLQNNLLNGILLLYDSNGNLVESRQYKMGKPTGSFIKYDGKKRIICRMSFGNKKKYYNFTYAGDDEIKPVETIRFRVK